MDSRRSRRDSVLPGASRNSTVFRIRKPLSPHRCDSAAVRRVERELAGGAGVMEALGRREPSAARIRNVRLRSRDGAGAISGWASGDIPVVPGAVDGLVEAISARGPLLAVTGWSGGHRTRSAGRMGARVRRQPPYHGVRPERVPA